MRARLRAVLAALGSAGLVCIVVGTFLPWLYSGRRARDSYAAGGAARRLLGLGRAGDAAVTAWPFVALACAVAIAALLLGWLRTAAVVGLLAAAAAATGAIAVLSAGGNAAAQPAAAGPVVTLVGSATVAAATTLLLLNVGPTTGPTTGRISRRRR